MRAQADAVALKHGMTGRWGGHGSITEVCEDSTIDPKHLFKLGYFRSSYNERGIERVMRNINLPGLHDIFGVKGEEYNVRPDWQEALEIGRAHV